MNVIVCGSRHWPSAQVAEIYERLGQFSERTVIITGGARGVDTWADQAAKGHGLDRIVVPANWARYGKAAGPIRNQWMLEIANSLGGLELVLAFRAPGRSAGTDNMIALAHATEAAVEVIHLPERPPRPAFTSLGGPPDGPIAMAEAFEEIERRHLGQG